MTTHLVRLQFVAGGPAVTGEWSDGTTARRTWRDWVNASRQVGGALAVAVFGALVAQQAGFFHGLRTSLLIAALLVLATTATSLLLRPAAALNALKKEARA
ncbi:hypothetical protein [Streptomyces diastatochromogenes]|uniref:hypothetical protein n=1 Tax=Streptomyces diastatochromogenes TaxID=42236 RepID=UPI0036BBE291